MTPTTVAQRLWRSAGASHVGHVRRLNEDAWLARPELGLWAVADGMGGHDAGDFASASIVDALRRVPPATDLADLTDQVEDALLAVNAALRAAAAQRRVQTIGSTAAVLLLDRDRAICLWAGDSRIYRLRDGTLAQMTADHSVVEELIGRGELAPADAERHPARNVLTRAVGADDALLLEADMQQRAPGERYLVCSDGLYRELPPAEIARLLAAGSAEQAAENLLAQALAHGGRDNVTVVVIDTAADIARAG